MKEQCGMDSFDSANLSFWETYPETVGLFSTLLLTRPLSDVPTVTVRPENQHRPSLLLPVFP